MMDGPVPKVVKNGEGAALLKDLPRAAEIVAAVVEAAGRLVTVKMRAGWERGTEAAPGWPGFVRKRGRPLWRSTGVTGGFLQGKG